MNQDPQIAFPFLQEHQRGLAPIVRPRVTTRPSRRLEAHSVLSEAYESARQLLERELATRIEGGRVVLEVTDNRHTMISVRRDQGIYRVRVHRMFLDAGNDVVHALGRYVCRNDRAASTVLGRFIDLNQHRIRHARRVPRSVTIETAGKVFNLQEIFNDLNRRYFIGAIDARITWGQRLSKNGKRRRHNSIKMGSYSVEDKLIRIHPSLDRNFVPRSFLEWIVYHEMLHQKHAIPIVKGRRQFHTREFLNDESGFEHYHISRRWERENLNRILVY